MPDSIVANASTTAFVTIGASVSSAIDTLGDHDWFKVTLNAGQTYIFNVDASAAFTDSYISVRNSFGTELAFNDDIVSGINRSSQVVFTPVTSGVFFLDVSGFNESYLGNYTLRAATLPAYTIDQIATYLIDGGVPGSGFHFATTSITFNVQGLTVAEQSLARLALQVWDEVGSFTFVETTQTAQISFTDAGSNIAQTSSDGFSATVQISSDWNSGITAINSYSFQTYLHEIGHALGLGHGGPYNGSATYGIDNIYSNDSWANSVMSYFTQEEAGTGTYDYVMGPQLADIVAIANLYGASTTTRSGDTTYGFHSNASQLYHFDDAIYGGFAPALTLFDNGGNDTLDVSGYSQAQRINLNAETHSDAGGEINNIAIARGSVIENAIGGSGNDNITGNAVDNLLCGGGGSDTLNGGDGNDTLIGGIGADVLNGGLGIDTASYVTAAAAVVVNLSAPGGNTGDAAGDTYSSIEILTASDNNDTLYGSASGETINGGLDQIFGFGGNDTLNGGAGNDVIDGGAGVDTMDGGDGSDIFFVDVTTDVVIENNAVQATGGFDIVIATANFTLAANIEQLVLRGAANSGVGNDCDNILYGLESTLALTFDGGAGNDVIYGSTAGGNTLIGGDGVDTLLMYGGNNNANGGLGSDIYYTYTLSDALSEAGGDGIDTVYSNHSIAVGDGLEQIILYGTATSAVSTSLTDNNILFGNSTTGAVTLDGGGGADVLFGGSFADTLIGGAGVDLLFGFGGANNLQGGDATDIYYLQSGLDVITETVSGGFDTAYTQFAGTTTLAANVEQLILYGAATGGLGNGGNNYLYGHIASQAVTLDGAGGNDYLLDSGFSGDVLIGGAGNDQLDLRTGGNDVIKFAAGSGNDIVYGFDANPAGGQDIIDVSGRGFSAASIGGAIVVSASGGDTFVTIGGDTIQLTGVLSTDITANDFVF